MAKDRKQNEDSKCRLLLMGDEVKNVGPFSFRFLKLKIYWEEEGVIE